MTTAGMPAGYGSAESTRPSIVTEQSQRRTQPPTYDDCEQLHAHLLSPHQPLRSDGPAQDLMRVPRFLLFWSRLNFSVKFAAIIAVAGVLIAIIPRSLVSRENRNQASQRAADKVGLVVNLVAGQEASLASFASGMSQELAPAVSAGDTSVLLSTLQRYSQVNTSSDVVGVSG